MGKVNDFYLWLIEQGYDSLEISVLSDIALFDLVKKYKKDEEKYKVKNCKSDI